MPIRSIGDLTLQDVQASATQGDCLYGVDPLTGQCYNAPAGAPGSGTVPTQMNALVLVLGLAVIMLLIGDRR